MTIQTCSEEFIKRAVQYLPDGRLMDEDGRAIMMDWEEPIMKFQAGHICHSRIRPPGDILNVGYGMGFMDRAIETFYPKSHTIVEIHPQVQDKILSDGWAKIPHVRLLFGSWEKFVDYLPVYDGIYIDTWDDEKAEEFASALPKILRTGGIFSFFANPAKDFNGDRIKDSMIAALGNRFDVTFEAMPIQYPNKGDQYRSDIDSYWDIDTVKTYYAPVARFVG